MKNRNYTAMFGSGDTNNDVSSAISKYGKPLKIFYEDGGFIASLIYTDKIIIVGFDGEYRINVICSEIE